MWTFIRQLRRPDEFEVIARAGIWRMYDQLKLKSSGKAGGASKKPFDRLMNAVRWAFNKADNDRRRSLDKHDFGKLLELLGLRDSMDKETQKWTFEYIDCEPSSGVKGTNQEHLLLRQFKERVKSVYESEQNGEDREVWPIPEEGAKDDYPSLPGEDALS